MRGGVVLQNEAKERFFDILDELIDEGIDVENLSKNVDKKRYDSIRKRAVRAFGSYRNALREYGIYKPASYPTQLEVNRCFRITKNYSVEVDDLEIDRIKDIHNVDDYELSPFLKEAQQEIELEILDLFYRDFFPFDGMCTKRIEEEYPTPGYLIKKHFKSFIRYVESFGTPYEIFVQRQDQHVAIKQGYQFERILQEILEAIYSDVQIKPTIGDCRPDFIVNEGVELWIDAKLSEYSIFDHRCKSIGKYTQKTDNLLFIYAKGKRSKYVGDGYINAHISTLYDKLRQARREDLITKSENFIKEAVI